MEFTDWGYTAWKYQPTEITRRLERVEKTLQYMRDRNVRWDALAVMGTSGIWLAPLLTLHGHKVVLIRKPHEKAHGSVVEGPANCEISRLVFIDDLICTGNTIANAKHQLGVYQGEAPQDWFGKLKIVAVVLHDTRMGAAEDYRGLPVYGYIED